MSLEECPHCTLNRDALLRVGIHQIRHGRCLGENEHNSIDCSCNFLDGSEITDSFAVVVTTVDGDLDEVHGAALRGLSPDMAKLDYKVL